MAEFHDNAVKFGGEPIANALEKLRAVATEKEKKALEAAVQDWALHSAEADNPSVRDRSLKGGFLGTGIAERIVDIAKAHSEDKRVQEAIVALTGDGDAGRKLVTSANGDKRMDEINNKRVRLTGEDTFEERELMEEYRKIQGASKQLTTSVADHLDEASHGRQGKTSQRAAEPAATAGKDDAYLADTLKDMREKDPKLDKLLTALKEAGTDEAKRKDAAKDLAEEVVKYAEKHPDSKVATAAVERLAPGKGADLLAVVADSAEKQEKANQIINPPSDEIRNGLRPSNAEHRAALDEWHAQGGRHDAAHAALVAALTDKITKGEQPAPQPVAPAVAAAPAAAPEQVPHADAPKYTGRDYVTIVHANNGHTISGADLQIALKQLAKDQNIEINLGKHGVDGKVGGDTLAAFNKIFDAQVATPKDLKLTNLQISELEGAAVRYKKEHPHAVANAQSTHKAAAHQAGHETGATGSSTPTQKSGGKPAAGHKPDAADHETTPKTVKYIVSNELKPINPKLIQQMVAAGGSSDTDKLLDMKWFNERAKFIEDTYAKSNDGKAYAASHGGKQKVWNEALADMMHFKAEPIITGMKPAAVQAAAEPTHVISSTERLGEKGIRELAASLSHNDGMRDGHTSMAAVNKAIETSLGNTKDVVADGKLTDKELVAALSKYAKDHKVSVLRADEDILKAVAANANQFDPLGGAVALRTPKGPDSAGRGVS